MDRPVVHCGACGEETEPVEIDGRSRARCPACGWVFWDNPIPAAGAVVLRGADVLLCRRGRAPQQGLWDLPGGILERGESAEEGLVRELQEELGTAATLVGFLGSWAGEYGGRPTLNLLYTVTLDGEPEAHDDVAEVRWWPLDGLPELAWAHEAKGLQQVRRANR